MTTLLRKTMFTGVVLSAAMFAAGAANASTIEECTDIITKIQDDLNGAAGEGPCSAIAIIGRNPERTCASLNSKLDGAKTKLQTAKLIDAELKLMDFNESLDDLLNVGGKPKVEDYSFEAVMNLQDKAYGAIMCIQDIGKYQ